MQKRRIELVTEGATSASLHVTWCRLSASLWRHVGLFAAEPVALACMLRVCKTWRCALDKQAPTLGIWQRALESNADLLWMSKRAICDKSPDPFDASDDSKATKGDVKSEESKDTKHPKDTLLEMCRIRQNKRNGKWSVRHVQWPKHGWLNSIVNGIDYAWLEGPLDFVASTHRLHWPTMQVWGMPPARHDEFGERCLTTDQWVVYQQTYESVFHCFRTKRTVGKRKLQLGDQVGPHLDLSQHIGAVSRVQLLEGRPVVFSATPVEANCVPADRQHAQNSQTCQRGTPTWWRIDMHDLSVPDASARNTTGLVHVAGLPLSATDPHLQFGLHVCGHFFVVQHRSLSSLGFEAEMSIYEIGHWTAAVKQWKSVSLHLHEYAEHLMINEGFDRASLQWLRKWHVDCPPEGPLVVTPISPPTVQVDADVTIEYVRTVDTKTGGYEYDLVNRTTGIRHRTPIDASEGNPLVHLCPFYIYITGTSSSATILDFR